MEPSQACFEIIKKWEGCHRKRADGMIEAYLDPVDIWTIGWGSISNADTDARVGEGLVIDQATADRWLEVEVKEKTQGVEALLKTRCTQAMFDTLVSFSYNIGTSAFTNSTLLRKLNAGDYEGAAKEFDRWVKADGRVLQGLVNRRNDEEALFRSQGWPSMA